MAQVHYLPQSTVTDQLYKFLSKYQSLNTRVAYEKDVRQFFQAVKIKDIERLNEDDLQFTLTELDEYQELMQQEGMSGKTINRKLGTVKGFLTHMNKRSPDHGLSSNVEVFDLVDRLAEDTENHDAFEYDEYVKVAKWVKDNEKHGEIKSSLIRFSVQTGARLTECLSLTWRSFVEKKDYVEVTYKAKGNKTMVKQIDYDFYNELISLPSYEKDEKVFPLAKTTVQRMMQAIKDEFRFLDNRKIVFHSFRKTGGTFIYELTGDINEARIFLGHANVNTTQVYLKKRDYGLIGAVSMENNVKSDFYKDLSHEDLLKVIESMNKDQVLMINKKAQDMFNK